MKKISGLVFLIGLFLTSALVGAENVKLVKKTEIGSETQKELVFISPVQVKSDERGNIFILDARAPALKKFSPSLEFVNQIGSKGQGPGEMNAPDYIDLDRSGNVWLYDGGNLKLSVYDNDLKFLKAVNLEKTEVYSNFFITRKGNLILAKTAKVSDENIFYEFSPEGKLIRSFFNFFHPFAPRLKSPSEIVNFSRYISYFMNRTAINRDRNLIAFSFLTPENPYKVHLINMDGKIVRTCSNRIKNYDPGAFLEYLKTRKKPTDLFSLYVGINRILFTSRDLILVQIRIEKYDKDALVSTEFYSDIFSPAGKLLAEHLVSERLVGIDKDDNVYGIKEEESGAVKIVVYSLQVEK